MWKASERLAMRTSMLISPLGVSLWAFTVKAALSTSGLHFIVLSAVPMAPTMASGVLSEMNWHGRCTCLWCADRSMLFSARPPNMLTTSKAFSTRTPASSLPVSSSITSSLMASLISCALGTWRTAALESPEDLADTFFSPPQNQGSLAIWAKPMRLAGSATRILSNRLRTGAVNQLGYSKEALWILRKSCAMTGSSKGKKPARRTYRMTPMLHTSAARPS
mmetsp:Transcript_51121/g.91828  ORF Transcript_51121/g.91828 Transcript_51121/m.91828 type:complete len:221 (+) Transcript_51121:199-861(+)